MPAHTGQEANERLCGILSAGPQECVELVKKGSDRLACGGQAQSARIGQGLCGSGDLVEVVAAKKRQQVLLQRGIVHVCGSLKGDCAPGHCSVVGLVLVGVQKNAADELGRPRGRVPELARASIVAALLEVRGGNGGETPLKQVDAHWFSFPNGRQHPIEIFELAVLLLPVVHPRLVGDLAIDDQQRCRGIAHRVLRVEARLW